MFALTPKADIELANLPMLSVAGFLTEETMADDQPKRATTVSREDLYKQVWETPMSRLAAS